MKYTVSSTRAVPAQAEFVVSAGEEITLIAWKLEGRSRTYGVGWRKLCADAGILDPMQMARSGTSERILLGERLSMGQRLKV